MKLVSVRSESSSFLEIYGYIYRNSKDHNYFVFLLSSNPTGFKNL